MSRRRHGHSQSWSRDAVSYIFAFFLSISFLGMMLLLIVRLGVMTWVGFGCIMDDEYYELTLEYVQDKARSYSLPTGIDPAVLDGVFTFDEVKQEVDSTIAGALNGSGYRPDTATPRERILVNVKALFASDGVQVAEGDSVDQIAESYADDIISIYSDAIELPGLDAVVQIRNLYLSSFPVALICLAAFAALMTVLIVRLHHYMHRALRYVAYALGGAAAMGFVIPCVLLFSGFYKGLNLRPEYFYHFGVRLVTHVLKLSMLGSGVLLLIMFIMMFVIARMRKKSLRHSHGQQVF